jgi:antirestriction protein ArdC
MPEMQAFTDSEEYYSTLFHEMAHSTGHKSRLNRDNIHTVFNGSVEEYSKEELIAEIGAAILMAETGIEKNRTIENSAAYLKNWLMKLESDPKFIIQASSKAQKAVDHILGRKWDNDKEEG